MPKHMLNHLKIAAVLLLALTAGATSAQQTSALQSYDVEVVIFRILSGSATPEVWSAEQGLQPQLTVPADDEQATGAISAAPPVETTTETFPALPSARYKLSAIEDALKRNRNYQPLGHFGWTQPGFPRTEAHYMSIDPLVTGGGLSGRVALSRGRYLHLTLDLVLNDSSGERYILQHTRRMRSSERHYIDHPKFGVVALITPTQG